MRLLGRPNVHASARLIKSELHRAGKLIVQKRFTHIVKAKGVDDVQTDADVNVEELFKKFVDECFGEDFGIIGEEGIRRPPSGDCTTYLIIDPIDGTKTFTRRESFGVSCLIAEYENGVITSAYIFNPYTDELFYFREGSSSNWILFQDQEAQRIICPDSPILEKCYLGLRSDPRVYTKLVQEITLPREIGGVIKDSRAYSGSFALQITDLLRGIIQAVIVRPGTQKPWDCAAPWGLMNRMGHSAYFIKPNERALHQFPLIFNTEEVTWDSEVMFAKPEFAEKLALAFDLNIY